MPNNRRTLNLPIENFILVLSSFSIISQLSSEIIYNKYIVVFK